MNRRKFVKSLTAFVAGISFLPLLPKKLFAEKEISQNELEDNIVDLERHYWINGITGDDSNPGTKDKPWETLHAIPTVIDRNTYVHIGQHPPGGYEGPIPIPKAYNGTLYVLGETDPPPIIDMNAKIERGESKC